jgi:hypothetical protein
MYIQGVFKKRPNFSYKDFILQHFNHCPLQSSPLYCDTPFATFLPLFECFLERIFCDGAHFSYRIFLNLRVLKKRQNFLNSAPNSTERALRLLSAPSGRIWKRTAICPVSLWALVVALHPLNWARAQAVNYEGSSSSFSGSKYAEFYKFEISHSLYKFMYLLKFKVLLTVHRDIVIYPYIIKSNPHPFYSFRRLKNYMRIRIAVESWILEIW